MVRRWAAEHGCTVEIEKRPRVKSDCGTYLLDGPIYMLVAPDGYWLDVGYDRFSSFNEGSWADVWERIQREQPTVVPDEDTLHWEQNRGKLTGYIDSKPAVFVRSIKSAFQVLFSQPNDIYNCVAPDRDKAKEIAADILLVDEAGNPLSGRPHPFEEVAV